MTGRWVCCTCGNALPHGALFCPSCGIELEQPIPRDGGPAEVLKCGMCRGTGEYPPDGGFFQKGTCKACGGKGWVRV